MRALGSLLLCFLLCASSAASAVVNLLPQGPLELYPDDFGGDIAVCTEAQVLRATYDEFALPANATTLSFYFQGGVDCEASSVGAIQRVVLFSFGDSVDVLADCGNKALVLSGGVLGRLVFALPSWLSMDSMTFELTVDSAQQNPVTLCLRGAPLQGNSALGAALFAYLSQSRALLASGIWLGARTSLQRTARASFSQFWLATGSAPQGCKAEWPQLAAAAAANHAPTIAAVTQQPSGEVFVGDAVRFAAAAADVDDDSLRLAMTFYGVPPADCASAECGDASTQVYSGGNSASLAESVQFIRPGRFIVRVKASDGSGAVVTHDTAVVVRKAGDVSGRAPCCRHSPYVVAEALGRPVDQTVLRPASVYQAAQQRLGWSRQYMDGADVEAERLFDYGVLAPLPDVGPLRVLSCADTRLAGAGSPLVFGLAGASRAEVSGHNKALIIVPEAFAWANATEVECQTHWSGWQEASSPYLRTNAAGSPCSVGCTKSATEQLIRGTGMVEQYNQALIQSSYGALSLSPAVTVLDEVRLSRDPLLPGDDNYGYYETPARLALASQGLPYWMYLVLVPLAYHRSPDHRAWSGGMSSQGAVITECYATMYYATHETGHRLGFHHVGVFQLDSAQVAPSPLLGPGTFQGQQYTDRLDIMSCCKSDFGLYHRTLAGWLKGSGRLVIPMAELQRPTTRRLVLWPFDRSESRGRLVSVAVRRSAGEILLIGFRSASHWQEAGSGGLPPEEARQNVRGVEVGYLRREPGSSLQWSEKGLLDFNVVHGDWPDALPAGLKQAPRLSQFATLKEGYSWYDPGSKTLIALERIAGCDGAAGMNPYPHTAPGFYGFRGEWPFTERFAQADYAGYAALECAALVIRTALPPPPGRLELSVAAQAGGSAAPGSTPEEAPSMSCSLQDATTLAVSWPADVEASSVVWKDRLNRTLAATAPGPGQTSAALATALLPSSVHVLALDGRHTHAVVSSSGAQLTVQYKYYEVDAITHRQEQVARPAAAVRQECSTGSGGEGLVGLIVGVSLLGAALVLAAAALVLLLVGSRGRQRRGQVGRYEPASSGGSGGGDGKR